VGTGEKGFEPSDDAGLEAAALPVKLLPDDTTTGDPRIELGARVLETPMLPLHQSPILLRQNDIKAKLIERL